MEVPITSGTANGLGVKPAKETSAGELSPTCPLIRTFR